MGTDSDKNQSQQRSPFRLIQSDADRGAITFHLQGLFPKLDVFNAL